mgnify:CR=1 FL=1|jgi:hypothetical protein
MRETDQDLTNLQSVLDRSYADAGAHLLEIHTTERRLTAAQLAERLQGVCVLALATVTRDGRPLVGPVDGIFYRGEFWFGTGASALRVAHIERNPAVSGVYTVGESLAVTVHGVAEKVDLEGNDGFAEVCRSLYGDTWDSWVGVAPYYRIRPRAMYTFAMDETAAS